MSRVPAIPVAAMLGASVIAGAQDRQTPLRIAP
jgi:hypothetical protein